MLDTAANIYREMAERTGGDIYIGIVGPVRTGKSTLVKRIMETMVIPNMQNKYQKERARDELPQSGSGKTIMTSEPKFVPEEAVSVSPDGTTNLSVRMIDSVGYMIPGAMGAEEDGKPRMVTTPWYPQEIPMTQAAELGTKKIMDEHCSIGIVVTTDGSITDIPREDYEEAEARAITDMKATGKPFLVLVNSTQPQGREAQELRTKLEETHGISCLCVNCLTLQEEAVKEILSGILRAFPVQEVHIFLPRWLDTLSLDHPVKKELYHALRQIGGQLETLHQAETTLRGLDELDTVERALIDGMDLGTGIVSCQVKLPDGLFYDLLTEHSGFTVQNDGDLMKLLGELAQVKRSYDQVSAALEQVRATGYGIVMPQPEEMKLEEPKIVQKGGNYAVKLKASAPSIHMMRADIVTEISPMVGDQKQSEDLLRYLMKEAEDDPEKLWESNLFGRTVYDLVREGLRSKLDRMPEEAGYKLQATLSRIINEGSKGLLCIILS